MVQTDSTFQQVAAPYNKQESTNAIIVIKASESLISLSWQVSPTLAELVQSAELLSSLIKQHSITHVLHDVRNFNFNSIDLQKCLATTFFLKIMEAGIAKVAHVTNHTATELIMMDRIIDFVKYKVVGDRKIAFEICTSESGALEWLNNVDVRAFAKIQSKKQEVTIVQPEQKLATTLPLNKASLVGATLKSYKERILVALKFIYKPSKSLYTNI